jgi:hypothetical protein
MHVRLTQLDGKLPNLALMKLARWHRDQGDDIHFSRSPYRDMLEPDYGKVYGAAIFDFSADRVAQLRREFPEAIVGGTWDTANSLTVEQHLGVSENESYDYSIYPKFPESIGFTARGCRMKCGFCVVPGKEGKPRTVNTIADIWRGPGHPKHLHLLDNDFFGQPREQWLARLAEIRDGGFRVCFNQGINIRMIDDESAEAIASVPYYDDGFTVRRLYTAWDNIGDERQFFDGIDILARAGIPPRNVMAYMLIGYDRRETWERVFYRFNKMVALGIRPYPMVYGAANPHRTLPLGGCNQRIEHRTLAEFQRFVIRKAYTFVEFENYDVNAKGHAETRQLDLLSA